MSFLCFFFFSSINWYKCVCDSFQVDTWMMEVQRQQAILYPRAIGDGEDEFCSHQWHLFIVISLETPKDKHSTV